MPDLNFRPDDHPADDSAFTPLPDGWYVMIIVKSELKPTKANDGEYLELELVIPEGQQYASRRVWDRLTLRHPNEQTVQIAHRQLGDICRALGITALQATEELHGKPLRVKLKIKGDDTFGPRNEVQRYEAAPGVARPPSASGASGAPAAPPAAAASLPAAPAAGGNARPPWAR